MRCTAHSVKPPFIKHDAKWVKIRRRRHNDPLNLRLPAFLQDYLAHIIDVNNLPIRPEQVCALFGNIEDIYEFNR